jgi:hypothetical protein
LTCYVYFLEIKQTSSGHRPKSESGPIPDIGRKATELVISPIETEEQRLRAGSGEGAAGYVIEAVKIPLSGSVAGFAGDIGAVLTRQDILTNLQCGPSRPGRTGPARGDR